MIVRHLLVNIFRFIKQLKNQIACNHGVSTCVLRCDWTLTAAVQDLHSKSGVIHSFWLGINS